MKKFAETIRSVGLIANVDKPSAKALVRRATAALRADGLAVATDDATHRFASLGEDAVPHADARELARHADLILVFGGDGTMLCVARQVAGESTPILGINIGGLGFLTGVPSARLSQALKQIRAGDFTLEQRPLIQARGRLPGGPFDQCALNDFVISRGSASRMIELEVRVDDEIVTAYRCDGLIVSSPTGSTAYSLSAGGPIVNPNAAVFVLTPICPHTLSDRSLIVSLNSTIRVEVRSERLEILLTADGQVQTVLASGGQVTIRRHRRAVRLMRLGGDSFYSTLRTKLHWSGNNLERPA
ncbi:MAG TPA: NAD(+)/NADH kinase [Verrucomicrobiae bacterium]|nr:NAD(+)/NADH kinase [Verrucomicrobiae bacterium]